MSAPAPASVVRLLEPPLPVLLAGNQVTLLQGGDELFPAMIRALDSARHQVWVAAYIFHDDAAAGAVAQALVAAAVRGVQVRVVVDGFGSHQSLAALQAWFTPAGVDLAVFRPLNRWWNWFQPGQLRRMHQKLCVVDGEQAFVGGINLLDDRHDLNHGWSERPRLDFAVQLRGPVVAPVEQSLRAVWTRAKLGQDWRAEVVQLVRSAEPINALRTLGRQLKMFAPRAKQVAVGADPVLAAFVVRDNFRQRRAIERTLVEAFRGAARRIDLVTPYFYPGHRLRRTLLNAARRGVHVRLLLQGKLDYKLAGLAARVLYAELLAAGVEIFEYTPAFLHAKMALVDDHWVTVGSSNIDPLSLLLNLEANVVVSDPPFASCASAALEAALAESTRIIVSPMPPGWMGWASRALVAWLARWYLRMAGLNQRF